MRRIVFKLLSILLATHVVVGQESASQGKWIGTWKLNLSKSVFPPGETERPISVTRKMEPIPGGMRFTTERVNSSGVYMPRVLQYEATYDGKEVPVSGISAQPGQTASVKVIDQHTIEVVITIPGIGTGFEQVIVSSDGRTMTTRGRQTVPGQVINYVGVYDRVP